MKNRSHFDIKKYIHVSRKRSFVYLPGLVLISAFILYACNNKGPDYFASPTSTTMPNPDPVDRIKLETPVLLEPENGAVDVENPPALKWSLVPEVTAGYQVQVTVSESFDNDLLVDENVSEPIFEFEQSVLLEAKVKHFWKVLAKGGSGFNDPIDSEWSETFSFTPKVPDEEEPKRIETGLFTPSPLIKQLFGITDLGPHFAEFAANSIIAISGETDEHPGSFISFNPLIRVALQQWFLENFVWGTAAAVANPQGAQAVSALVAYGPWGLGLYNTQSPFPDSPDDIRTDFRVDDAVHAGGGLPTETIVFGSGDLGVGFIKFDPGLGRFAISDEILPKSDFFGDRIWAYVDDADAPAVVLARSQNSRLYFHRRDGGSPDLIATGLKIANSMRCLPPLCLVFSSDVEVPIFLFDGQNPPVRAADTELEFRPSRGALMHTESGGIAALIVGRATTGSNRDRVTEVEFAADGGVIREVPMEIPNGCSGPNGVVYVPDEGGVVAIVTCTTTHNYFVARSALFSEL